VVTTRNVLFERTRYAGTGGCNRAQLPRNRVVNNVVVKTVVILCGDDVWNSSLERSLASPPRDGVEPAEWSLTTLPRSGRAKNRSSARWSASGRSEFPTYAIGRATFADNFTTGWTRPEFGRYFFV